MYALFLPPFVMIFTIFLMILLNQLIPLVRFWEAHICWFGVPIVIIGIAIAKWHSRLFKKIGTNINTFKDPDIIVTGGLFQFSRNPMYLGFLTILTGTWIMLGSATPLLALAGFFILTNYWYIPLEERAMLAKFGKEYVDYKRKVRRWL